MISFSFNTALFDCCLFFSSNLDSLDHLLPSNNYTENSLDPVYETIDHSSFIDIKQKTSNANNTFFSKTKDKLVTAVNKLVDNYGNVPKKQTRPYLSAKETNHSMNNNEQKLNSTKRQAPLAEHIIRQQAQNQSSSTNENVTYENTHEILSTPAATRRAANVSSTKTSVNTCSSMRVFYVDI